ncbi:MAG: beta-N-acetylglucosaminidase domain-containing protein, partial [Ginsengibacter sp.]
MLKTIFYLLLFLLFFTGVKAQNTQTELFPQPQKVQLSSEGFPLKAYHISGSHKPDAQIISLLQGIFKFSNKGNEIPFEISVSEKDNNALNQSGAYRLALSPEKITINAFDERGLFYAVQTLYQLYKYENGVYTLPKGEITDYPDVAHRGTVEGFYGEPWTFQDRLEQLRFYGKLKLNTYIYGPKNDPFHSSPNWRLPYPTKEAAKIKTLV